MDKAVWSCALQALDSTVMERAVRVYGTPLVLFDEASLDKRFCLVREALEGVRLFFPFKSCPLSYIRSFLTQRGTGADVASPQELEAAIALNVSPGAIVLNQPLRDRNALEQAIRIGAYIVADGIEDLDAILSLAPANKPPVKVIARINVGVGAPVWTRFGIPLESAELIEFFQVARRSPHIHLVGLHTHLGTNIWTSVPYRQASEKIASLWPVLEEILDYPLEVMDFGGGFASPWSCPINKRNENWLPAPPNHILAVWRAPMENAGLAHRVSLWCEPGRILVEDAAVLITQVKIIKKAPSGPLIICDAGINLLPTSGYIRHPVRGIPDTNDTLCPTSEFDLTGSLCMQSDILGCGLSLPADLTSGDLLAISSVGAYDLSLSFPFITGRCPVVLVDRNGILKRIRRRETTRDLYMLEHSP